MADDQSFTYLLGTNRWYVVDIVLVALGEQPDLSFLPEVEDQPVFQYGNDWSREETSFTTLPDVFAAGDVASVSPAHRTLLHALTGGCEAAHTIHQSLCVHPVVCDETWQHVGRPACREG